MVRFLSILVPPIFINVSRYHDSMPLVFKDEVCYEKTPDYFDRPFVPERMSKLDNAKDVKFVHVLCDPVRRSFSHFNHMFTVQATGQGGVGEAQPGFEFLNGNLICYHMSTRKKRILSQFRGYSSRRSLC